MNHIYQLVWNSLHQAWVAVSEVASGLGSRSTMDQRRRPGAAGGTVPARFTIKTIAACAHAISAGALFLINSLQVSAQTIAPTTLPQGGVVTQGAATLQGAGSSVAPVLNVNQTSQRAVINWNTFNLGSAATVNFNQPNAQSATLNRVLDMNPSQIFGRINAPGQVTLINPAGVYFSPSAVLDVGALTASTLNQTDADFMAGTARFHRNGSTASVVNEGTLTAADTIALLAPEVRNQGTVTASAVVMAAGESIQLHFDPFSRLASISVTPSQIAALVENRTAVLAPGGQIILSATALSGLQASVIHSGQIDASSLSSKGGRIVLEGDSIQLSPGSSLNARGATGGGTVLVGGDWQGSGSMVQATTVNLAQGASIDASATHSGDGGKVVLWSDVHNANSVTTVNGRITANGIAVGGQVETSGHTVVMDTAQVQAGGQGSAGLWLIDPYNYTIGAGQATTISASLSGGTSVTVDTTVDVPATGSSGNVGDAGNIAVNANITKTGGVDSTLTLRAHNDIEVASNVAISATTNRLNVVFNSDLDGSGAGAIKLNTGSGITSNGGNITLGGGVAGDASGNAMGSAGHAVGIALVGAALNAGGGNVALRGTGRTNSDGVSLGSGSTVTTSGAGTISLTGTGGAGTSSSVVGVMVDSSTVGTSSGAITVNGTGGASTGTANDGVRFAGSAQVATTGGHINLTGAGGGTGSASRSNDGVHVEGTALVRAGGAGNLTIVGAGGNGTDGDSDGVSLFTGATLQTASGTLSITGTGGNGDTVDYGIYMPGGTVQTTAGGNIQMTGTATPGSDDAHGVHVADGQVRTTGGGNIVLTGTAGGGSNSQGVRLASNAAVSTSSGTVQILGTLVGGATAVSSAVSIDGGSSVSANGAISIQGDTLGQAGAVGVRLGTSSIGTTNNNAITITTDSYNGTGTQTVSAGTGNVTIRNRTAGTLVNLGGADVLAGSPLTLGLSAAELARITAGNLVIGRNDATAAGAMTVSSAVAPTLATNVVLRTGSTLAVNAPITVNNTLTFSALGNVSQAVGGNITATNLLLNGPGNYALATASSNAVTTLAALGAGVVSYQNSSALQIGSVDGVDGITASGAVYVGTATGNLTVAQNVTTTDTSSAAVLLNAGVASAAGTASGGNIVFSGSPAISTGSGGRTTLMTGSVADSTGLTSFVGAGSGRFRYNSDEVTTNYTAPLGTGAYGIYREAPTVDLATGNVSITYGDTLPSLSASVSGAVNGDVLGASVAVGGALSGSLNYTAGSHTLTPGSASALALGYAVGTVTAGSLSVAQKTLTSSLVGIDRNYDGSTSATVNAAPGGLTGGDSVVLAYTAANFADKNVGTGKAINVTGISLVGADALNYTIASTGSANASIFAAPITLASSTVNKTYDGSVGAPGTATVSAGTLFGGDSLSGGTFAFTDKNVGPGKTVTASGITVNDGNGGANYLVSYANNTSSSISPAGLTVTAPTITKVYDGTTNATGNAIVGALAGAAAGEQVGLAATLAYTDQNVGIGNKTTRAAGLTVVDSSGTDVTANYVVNYVDNTVSSITPAPLTVTANADARFVGKPDVPGYAGAHFDGLVGGETPSVLSGTLAIDRPNALTETAVGSYAGALVPSGLTSGNYSISFVPGTFTIVPAEQLLVRLVNTSTVYGTAPTLNVFSVQYLAADQTTIIDLAGSGVANTYNYTDGVGGGITFTPGPQGAGSSSAGHTPVGNYALGDAAPSVVGNNFKGSPVFVGNLAVTPKPITPSATGIDKTYNGSTDMPNLVLNPAGLEPGDNLVVNGSGAFAFDNVGNNLPYVVRDMALAGADAGNYYLAGSNFLGGSNANITPAAITISTSDVVKTYDGTTSALGSAVVTGGTLFGGDTLVGGTFMFTDKNAGLGNKTVTASGIVVADGNGGGNYTVTYANNTTSTITPASITVATSSVSKPFDGTTNAQGTAVVAGGSLFGTDRLVGGTFAFTDPDVGDNKTVLTSGVQIDDGNGGGNYTITYAGNSTSRIVVPALPVVGVWTKEILLPHPPAVPASPLAPSQSALEGVAVGASAVGREGGAAAGKGAAGCVGTSQTGLDCDRRDGRNGYVVVTPVRNMSPVLAGQVLVQVVGLRDGAFEAALPVQASTILRAQAKPATATLPNGQPLPAWLRFDPQSLAFTAQAVPASAMPLTALVRSNNYQVEVEMSEIR